MTDDATAYRHFRAWRQTPAHPGAQGRSMGLHRPQTDEKPSASTTPC